MSNEYYSVQAEEYIFSLEDDVLKVVNENGTKRDEFDITTIAHIQCITSHKDHKILALLFLAVGGLVFIIGVLETEYTYFMIVGLGILIFGAILIAYSKDETNFQVTLQGINNIFNYNNWIYS